MTVQAPTDVSSVKTTESLCLIVALYQTTETSPVIALINAIFVV